MWRKNPFSGSANGPMIGLAVLFSALVMLALWKLGPIQETPTTPTETASPAPTPKSKPDKNSWFEEKRFIYHGIPSRILFLLESPDKKREAQLAHDAWQEFERIGKVFNPFDPTSETGRLNRRTSSKNIKISEDIRRVLQQISSMYDASGGAFDPTLWPIKKLWREAVERQRLPSDEELAQAAEATGFDFVHGFDGDDRLLTLDREDLQFDFGGIAKGYAVDRVRELLEAGGAVAGLVQCGGEISTFGEKTDGAWSIGVQHPTDLRSLWGVLHAKTGMRVSTSGNYRQPLNIAGKSYYHIFNPKDGRPVSERIAGVTVASFDERVSNAILDACATAITVLGSKKGMELAERLGVETLILVHVENTIQKVVSPGFSSHFRKRKNLQ